MSNFDQLIPPHVRVLGAYTPGKPLGQAEQESGVPCVKLASNENPFGPSPLALEAMRNALAKGNFYPDDNSDALREALAAKHNLEPNQILVTPGSTGLLNLSARTLLTPGLNAVTRWSREPRAPHFLKLRCAITASISMQSSEPSTPIRAWFFSRTPTTPRARSSTPQLSTDSWIASRNTWLL